MPAHIRHAHPTEAPQLTALALRSKAFWGYDADFMRRCTTDLTFDAALCAQSFVVEHNGALCALSSLAPHPQDPTTAELLNLFVDPPHMGHGYGRLLWNHALTWSAAQGCTRIHIEADPNAAPFYTRMGAQVIGTVLSSCIEGRTLPLMSYRLDAEDKINHASRS